MDAGAAAVGLHQSACVSAAEVSWSGADPVGGGDGRDRHGEYDDAA